MNAIKTTTLSFVLIVLIFLLSTASVFGDLKLNQKLLASHSDNPDAFLITKQIFMSFTDFSAVKINSFTVAENSHLDDVVSVLRDMSYAALILLLLWVFMFVNSPKPVVLIIGSVVSVVILGLLYFVQFDLLFSYIHQPFFSSGTWEFSANSLLIQTYPLEYWQALGFNIGCRIAVSSVFLFLLGIFGLFYKKYK